MRLPMIDGGCFRGVGGGMPVVAAPAEMDIATVGELRAVLLAAAVAGHAVIVVDMTGTRMCDSSGLRVLAEAHRRAMAAGGELRLVLPAAGSVVHVLALTGVSRFIPSFGSLEDALTEDLPA